MRLSARSVVWPQGCEHINKDSLLIRTFERGDPARLEVAFALSKPSATFERYMREEAEGGRACWVATIGDEPVGYVTLLWCTDYVPLADEHVPEIQDLNVTPGVRRRGIASRLLDVAEQVAATRSRVVAIAVGLHAGYNAAQRLYVLRGYVPDGCGLTYGDRFVGEYEDVTLDDSLVLHMTKELR